MHGWEEFVSTHAVEMPVRPRRPMRSLANRERQKARKILVWHQLRQAGVSFRSIAGDCGLSHVTIRTYTSPEWVEWARGVLSGGKAETAPGLN